MQAHSGFLLRNCYPNCLVPQLLLNFLLLPCLSFLCSVFNVQIVDASFVSFASAQAPKLTHFAASPLPRELPFARTGTRVFLRLLKLQTSDAFEV